MKGLFSLICYEHRGHKKVVQTNLSKLNKRSLLEWAGQSLKTLLTVKDSMTNYIHAAFANWIRSSLFVDFHTSQNRKGFLQQFPLWDIFQVLTEMFTFNPFIWYLFTFFPQPSINTIQSITPGLLSIKHFIAIYLNSFQAKIYIIYSWYFDFKNGGFLLAVD